MGQCLTWPLKWRVQEFPLFVPISNQKFIRDIGPPQRQIWVIRKMVCMTDKAGPAGVILRTWYCNNLLLNGSDPSSDTPETILYNFIRSDNLQHYPIIGCGGWERMTAPPNHAVSDRRSSLEIVSYPYQFQIQLPINGATDYTARCRAELLQVDEDTDLTFFSARG